MWPILFAAQLSGAIAPDLEKRLGARDVPASLLLARNEGTWRSHYQVLVAEDGRTIGCRIETSSGVGELDALTCASILERAEFRPARWMDGSPAVGVVRGSIEYKVEPRSAGQAADIALTVSALPRSVQSPVTVNVDFAADPHGNIVDCLALAERQPTGRGLDPALALAACQVVKQDWKPAPVKGAGGVPIRSVQNASVEFSLPGAGRSRR